MDGSALYFTGRRAVETRPVDVGPVGEDEVVVETDASAISAGTELLVYRDQAPAGVRVDETIDALDGDFSYPLRYGYATAGEVVEAGTEVDEDWLGRTVFSFRPHQTRFVDRPDALIAVPDGVTAEEATLLPTVETATNVVLDCAPRIGETAVVFGAGVVGLWTARLLAAFPLDRLVVVDPIETRRAAARAFGADAAIRPDVVGDRVSDVDLAVELSGRPSVLDDAVGAVGYDGRVVVGSWYGSKRVNVDLGGRFHRDRVSIASSQVSTIDPALRGRWDTDRRLDVALDWLDRVDAASLISHRIPFADAADAYDLLDRRPEEALQVLLTY